MDAIRGNKIAKEEIKKLQNDDRQIESVGHNPHSIRHLS